MNKINALLGTVILHFASLAGTACQSDGDDKDHETRTADMSLGEVPWSVRNAFERESDGGRVSDIQRKVKDGRTTYVGTVRTASEEKWRLTLDESGNVISRKKR